MESRYLPLDGAKSVEISALLTYVNYTKFMNLPTSTLADFLSNPRKYSWIIKYSKIYIWGKFPEKSNKYNRLMKYVFGVMILWT